MRTLTLTLTLIFICLLIYFIQPYFKISFFSKQDSEQSSSEISKYSFLLYGYEKKDDNNEYICQYKCKESIENIEDLKNKDNCSIYYLETKFSGLDNTSLDMIKTPFNFWGNIPSKKSFNLKNVRDLISLNTKEQKSDEKFCEYNPYSTLDKKPVRYFIKIYDNDYYNQDLYLNLQDESTNWDRYLVSIPSKKIKDLTMYHYKEIKDNFILMGTTDLEEDAIKKMRDLLSKEYRLSTKLNKILVQTINTQCLNTYNTKKVLRLKDLNNEKTIKKIHLHNNLEYLGLNLKDIIIDNQSPLSNGYALAYGGYVDSECINFENQKILCLKNIVQIREEDDLRFIEEDIGTKEEDIENKEKEKEKEKNNTDITLLTFRINPN